MNAARISIPLLAPAAAMLALMAGCETISQDLNLALKDILPPAPSEAARMMIDEYDPDSRREGTAWIANAPFGGAEVYVELYRERLHIEHDPTVKSALIQALGRHGAPEDARLIARFLKDDNEFVRWDAAKALQRLHDPVVISDLLDVLRNDAERSETRAAVAIALGQYPSDRVFQGLLNALDARELSVNMAAEQSLSTLTGQGFGMDLVAWNRWYREQSPDERFANGREYLYPTYTRDISLLESLAFWSPRNFEQPAPPTGLTLRSQRTTSDFAEPENP